LDGISNKIMSDQILVAGIGNIFLGDDAFGVEVVQRLMRENLPEYVEVKDFGIRSFDLAYALMEDYKATILVDATQQGQPPGTVYLIEPDLSDLDALEGEMLEAHNMNPVKVLLMVKQLGGQPKQLYLVGCEPAVLETEDGFIGLSEPVQAAVDEAIEMIKSFISTLT
jgi:hydrogenase maturation protease